MLDTMEIHYPLSAIIRPVKKMDKKEENNFLQPSMEQPIAHEYRKRFLRNC